MKDILISIITPCFNGEKYIESTYQSIFNQTYSNWEWIVVDDASSDNSLSILNNIAQEDKRVVVISLQDNKGSGHARNIALSKSKGKYITFLDVDDLIDPTYLDIQSKFLLEKGGVVTCGYRVIEGNKKEYEYIPPMVTNYKKMLASDTLSCLTTMIESSLIEGRKFAEDLNSVEDYPFMLSIVNKAGNAYCNPVVLATYRRNESSKTKHRLSLIKDFYKVYRKYCYFNPIKSFIYVIRYIIKRLFKYS